LVIDQRLLIINYWLLIVFILPLILNYCHQFLENMWKTSKNIFLDLFWPKRCINCGKEGEYLCDDCFALIEISNKPSWQRFKYLDTLYFASNYENKIVQTALHLLKYGYVKDISKILASLIIAQFKLLDNRPDFSNSILCAVPLHKTRLRQRRFNQAEEIAKHLSKSLNIPFEPGLLLKTKKTLPQMTLNRNERIKNVSGAFEINPQKKNKVFGKNILLVDDVFTTGATMEECSRILKQNHAQSVWGVVVARD